MKGKVTIKPLKDDGGPHTPGPWTVIPPGHGHPSEYLCVQVGGDELYATLEMRPADARLVAAAPDLLEACEEALRFLNSHSTAIPDGSGLNRATRLLGDAARKARGD